MARPDQELDYTLARLTNNQGVAEGPTIPPKLQGGVRIPSVTALRVARSQAIPLGGTQVTLTWSNPPNNNFINGYNILVFGLLPGNQPTGPFFATGSPGVVTLQVTQTSRLTFVVQTLLKNGQTSQVEQSPSVSATFEISSVTPDDIPDGTITVPMLAAGVPGELITWDPTGLPDTFGPGATNTIVSGNGVGVEPTFKTRAALDLVLGNSNLTTAGAIPVVVSAGTVTSYPTKFFYDNTNEYLGVGTNVPLATLHAFESVLGTAVQILESDGGGGTNPNETVYQGKVLTTDNTPTVLSTFSVPVNTTYAIEVQVVARRTGGSSGTAEDGARYWLSAVYKNVAGTATIIGTVSQITDEDQPAWDCYLSVSASTVLLIVLGATNNSISWSGTFRVNTIST